MTFAYHIQAASRQMHRLNLQYLRLKYQEVELKDAIAFDLGTSSQSEVTGSPLFTTPEFVRTYDICLDKISFDPFCEENKNIAIDNATTIFDNGGYTQEQYDQLIYTYNTVWSPEYATSANIAGWSVFFNNRWIQVKTMGDRTEDVAKYYLKLATYGQV